MPAKLRPGGTTIQIEAFGQWKVLRELDTLTIQADDGTPLCTIEYLSPGSLRVYRGNDFWVQHGAADVSSS